MDYQKGRLDGVQILSLVLAIIVCGLVILASTTKLEANDLNLNDSKLKDYRIIVKPLENGNYMAVGVHLEVPSSITTNVLQSTSIENILLVSQHYSVVVVEGRSAVDALSSLQQSIKNPTINRKK